VATNAVAQWHVTEVKVRRPQLVLGCDHQGRLGAVNLGPFDGVDLNLRPTVAGLYSPLCADTDVK